MGCLVAYYRVSTKRQGLGLEAQEATVANYLRSGPYNLAAAFTEKETGTSKGNDRPQLAKALHACRVRKCKLIVANVSRLTRSPAFLAQLLESGVEVCFADLPVVDGPMGRFIIQEMANVAELEAGLIQQRTKAALAVTKANGTKLGGYRGVQTLSDETRAKATATIKAKADTWAQDVMVEIETLRASGVTSLEKIAAALNEKGIKTSRNGRWQATQVSRVISRLGG
jgi:DNA invertase Pin-like site-specific DNA recombinase